MFFILKLVLLYRTTLLKLLFISAIVILLIKLSMSKQNTGNMF